MAENKVLIFLIDWDIIQELIINKIENLPEDAKIVGITRDGRKETELIGLSSDNFKNIPMGQLVPEIHMRAVYNKNGKISKLKYKK